MAASPPYRLGERHRRDWASTTTARSRKPAETIVVGIEQGGEPAGPVELHVVWKALGSRLHGHTA
jgi:hypothetical protein